MPMYGKIQPFESDGLDWGSYLEQVDQFFSANDVEDVAKQRSVFLASCGMKCYAVLRKLVAPKLPKEIEFSEIKRLLSNYYSPVPSEIVSRYKFHTRSRLEGKSITSFVAELQDLSKYCNFGDVLEDMLRDRLVCGINNDRIQERLFSEPLLSYEKAVTIAVAFETATRDVASVQDDSFSKRQAPTVQEAGINRVFRTASDSKKSSAKIGEATNKDNGIRCFRCGYNHLANTCRHRESRCFKCRKIGHLANVCKSEADNTRSVKENRVNAVETQNEVNAVSLWEADVYPLQTVFKVGEKAKLPILVALKIDGKAMSMELDTGAAISVISKQCFDDHWRASDLVKLKPSRIKLKGYFGQIIEAVGEMPVTVEYRNSKYNLSLCVAPGKGPSLLGRDWIAALDILPQIFNLCELKVSNSAIDALLNRFEDVFSGELGTMKDVIAKIAVPPGVKPKFFKSRQVPFAMQDKIEAEIDRLVAGGILVPVRYSNWAAPIVSVLKSDGTVRITGDFKITVNSVSNLEQYPVPRIEELFTKLSGGQKFTKLDLRDAYFQMQLDEASQEFVTINTPKGLFRYTRLPQGLASAPAIFIRAMDGLLGNLKKVATFFDDILITGKDDKEHLETLEEVLKRLEVAGLKLKCPKCGFLQNDITYLGYRLDKHGLHPTHDKVQAIKDAPEPKNVKELQSFLGLLNHYRRFMPNLSNILAPLHKLLQNEVSWSWSESESSAFNQSKALLTSEDLLVFFYPINPIVVSCDASPYGVGGVLSHRFSDGVERPVGFVSRSLCKTEQNYSQLDKEALALTFAVVKFHQYLFGFRFELQTDHKPLLGLFKSNKPLPVLSSPRVIQWAIMLSAYDFELVYKPGEKNCNADALSRLPLVMEPFPVPQPAEIFMLEKEYPNLLSATIIANFTNRDPMLSRIRSQLWSGEDINSENPDIQHFARRQNELSVQGNCVLWGSRVVIPMQLREQVLHLLHEGHPGMVKMKSIARLHVWWPNLDKDIEDRVRLCSVCQSLGRSALGRPMHSWPFPGKPWSRLHIDHAGPFHGKLYLIIVDVFSKWIDVSEFYIIQGHDRMSSKGFFKSWVT